MIHFLPPKKVTKFTKKKVTEQIMKRFIPNENYQEAKLKFITQMVVKLAHVEMELDAWLIF